MNVQTRAQRAAVTAFGLCAVMLAAVAASRPIALTLPSAAPAHPSVSSPTPATPVPPVAAQGAPAPTPTSAEVLAATRADDWRPLDPENTLYLELATGRVVIELAPAFAPRHVANVKALAREGYFDGLAIMRSQDNYVVQWGDPNERRRAKRARSRRRSARCRPSSTAARRGPAVHAAAGRRRLRARGRLVAGGFPAARDPQAGSAWLAHCYGMVGAGRDDAADSGGGTELYVVIGHAPRHLDRNVTLLGRVRARHGAALDAAARHRARWASTRSRSSACRSGRSASPPTCRLPSARRSSCCAPTRPPSPR